MKVVEIMKEIREVGKKDKKEDSQEQELNLRLDSRFNSDGRIERAINNAAGEIKNKNFETKAPKAARKLFDSVNHQEVQSSESSEDGKNSMEFELQKREKNYKTYYEESSDSDLNNCSRELEDALSGDTLEIKIALEQELDKAIKEKEINLRENLKTENLIQNSAQSRSRIKISSHLKRRKESLKIKPPEQALSILSQNISEEPRHRSTSVPRMRNKANKLPTTPNKSIASQRLKRDKSNPTTLIKRKVNQKKAKEMVKDITKDEIKSNLKRHKKDRLFSHRRSAISAKKAKGVSNRSENPHFKSLLVSDRPVERQPSKSKISWRLNERRNEEKESKIKKKSQGKNLSKVAIDFNNLGINGSKFSDLRAKILKENKKAVMNIRKSLFSHPSVSEQEYHSNKKEIKEPISTKTNIPEFTFHSSNKENFNLRYLNDQNIVLTEEKELDKDYLLGKITMSGTKCSTHLNQATHMNHLSHLNYPGSPNQLRSQASPSSTSKPLPPTTNPVLCRNNLQPAKNPAFLNLKGPIYQRQAGIFPGSPPNLLSLPPKPHPRSPSPLSISRRQGSGGKSPSPSSQPTQGHSLLRKYSLLARDNKRENSLMRAKDKKPAKELSKELAKGTKAQKLKTKEKRRRPGSVVSKITDKSTKRKKNPRKVNK